MNCNTSEANSQTEKIHRSHFHSRGKIGDRTRRGLVVSCLRSGQHVMCRCPNFSTIIQHDTYCCRPELLLLRDEDPCRFRWAGGGVRSCGGPAEPPPGPPAARSVPPRRASGERPRSAWYPRGFRPRLEGRRHDAPVGEAELELDGARLALGEAVDLHAAAHVVLRAGRRVLVEDRSLGVRRSRAPYKDRPTARRRASSQYFGAASSRWGRRGALPRTWLARG